MHNNVKVDETTFLVSAANGNTVYNKVRTEADASRLGTGPDGVLLDHVEEVVHPVLLDLRFYNDADGHGGERSSREGGSRRVDGAGGVEAAEGRVGREGRGGLTALGERRRGVGL